MPDLIDEAELQRQIEQITHLDLRPAMDEIGQTLLLSIEDNVAEGGRFAPGEGAAGTPSAWTGGTQKFAPLSESTQKSKARRGRSGGKILHDSGRMMAAMDTKSTSSTVEITNNVDYFPHVTLGTKPGTSPKLEARPLLVVQQEDIEEIGHIISDFLTKELS